MILQITCNRSGSISRRSLKPQEKLYLPRLIKRWAGLRHLKVTGTDPVAPGDYSAKVAEDPDSVTCFDSIEFWAEPLA